MKSGRNNLHCLQVVQVGEVVGGDSGLSIVTVGGGINEQFIVCMDVVRWPNEGL